MMSNFQQFVYTLLAETFALSDDKGKDYRRGSNVVHQNFINVGNDFRIPAIVVLGIYMKKHFDAIHSYFNLHQSESEPIRERIKDAINYLILGMPLIAGETPQQDEYNVFRDKVAGSLKQSLTEIEGQAEELGKEKLVEYIDNGFTIITAQAIPQRDVELYYKVGSSLIANLIALLYFEQNEQE